MNGVDGKTEEIVYGNISKARINIYGNDMLGFAQRNKDQVQRYYYIKDYLGSNRVVVDENHWIMSAEDFGPFGATLEGRSINYGLQDSRYKFVNMERDVETGYDNNDDRIYDSRIFRSNSVDPFASKDPSQSPYSYAGNNPIKFYDAHGDSIKSEGESRDEDLSDLQSVLDNPENTNRLSLNAGGYLMINTNGYVNGSDPKLDFLITINNDTRIIGYACDLTTKFNVAEIQNDGTLKDSHIKNLSITNRWIGTKLEKYFTKGTEQERATLKAMGLSGYISIPRGITVTDYYDNVKTRGELVGHEIGENYLRTNQQYPYVVAHFLMGYYYGFYGGSSGAEDDYLKFKIWPFITK